MSVTLPFVTSVRSGSLPPLFGYSMRHMLSKRVLARRIALLSITSVVVVIVGMWLFIRRDLAATRAAVRGSATRDVPMTVVNAFTAAEDPCHWKHHRAYTLAAVAAIFFPYNNSVETELAGHASLANQLVRQHVNGHGLTRQTREMLITAVVEATENPATVARAYVNSVYLGTTDGMHIYGVTDAAWKYYGKRPAQLNLAQSVVLAASVRSPRAYSPHVQSDRAIARRLSVLTRLRTSGLVSQQDSERVERSLRSTAG